MKSNIILDCMANKKVLKNNSCTVHNLSIKIMPSTLKIRITHDQTSMDIRLV